jgi:hypothetical protein
MPIEGILDEGKEIMEEYADTPALDAGLLAAAQAVEHYEISRYGTLKAWALKLNNPQAAKLLDQTLAEEKKTDDSLTKPRRPSTTRPRPETRHPGGGADVFKTGAAGFACKPTDHHLGPHEQNRSRGQAAHRA